MRRNHKLESKLAEEIVGYVLVNTDDYFAAEKELAQLSHNKPSIPVCPHYSREMVKSSEYVEFDICTCQGNTGKPAHVG
jgi:hypothetical protein